MINSLFEPADIIVFPIIDWHYRFQRPQQISSRLASRGHRVFYLRTYFLHGTSPTVKPIRSDLPIFDVQLGLPTPMNIVADQLDESSIQVLLEQINGLRESQNIAKAICFVELPFWGPLVLELQKKCRWKIMYDALDHLSGFSNVTAHMLEPEAELIDHSDVVLATSHLLFEEKTRQNANCLFIPNATEFDHFNYVPEQLPEDIAGIEKPILGYYGAISDWFDTELLASLASARPHWNFVLIGRVENIDISALQEMPNVFFLGEKPYAHLPAYLHVFDACIIPFKKIPLTEATNPVKLFEFLSAGKAVVATDLNELRYYQDYARLASSVSEWLNAMELALEDNSPAVREKRMRFARQNTWNDRMFAIEDAILRLDQPDRDVPQALPLIFPEDHLVSCRRLTQHDGIEYWCFLYEKDGIIYKQTSSDLAQREARFLSRFESDYFPRTLNSWTEGEYSVISFQKIQGQTLQETLPQLNASAEELYRFIQHGLRLLRQLSDQAITHRNINRETVLMQANQPLLLDFGWAVSEQDAYISPIGLGGYERPPDGRFSDVYSMGKIFEYVNRLHYPAFDRVISLMTAREAQMRITDLSVLEVLFKSALETTRQMTNDQVQYD